jgi:hypothetical protein
LTADNSSSSNAHRQSDSEGAKPNFSREGKNASEPTKEQLELREFVKLLGELQSKGKISGQQFRENRELWIHQQPNDRDVLVWHLKQLLNTETKQVAPKSQAFQKPRRM